MQAADAVAPRPRFGFSTTVCGLSQAGMPCAAGIPATGRRPR